MGQAIILFAASVLSFAIAGMAKYSNCSSNIAFAQSAGLPTCNSMVDATFLALAFGVIFLFAAGIVLYTRRKVLSIIMEEAPKNTQATSCRNCGTRAQDGAGFCANCGKQLYPQAIQ